MFPHEPQELSKIVSNATRDFKRWNSGARAKIEVGQVGKEMCAGSQGSLFLPFTMVRTQEKEMKAHERNAGLKKKVE